MVRLPQTPKTKMKFADKREATATTVHWGYGTGYGLSVTVI
jgi:hypothetical protein